MRKLTKTAAVVAAMATMVMGATVMTNAAELKNAWSQENGSWYYYNEKGNKVTNQWVQAGEDWYFLGEEGKMLTEEFVADKAEIDAADADAYEDVYFVDKEGKMVSQSWVKITDSAKNPIAKDSDSWYFFGSTGVMYQEAWVACGDDWYFINDGGKMATLQRVSGLGEDDNTYYVDKNGKMVTGWYKATKDDEEESDLGVAKDEWIYAEANGNIDKSTQGWKKIDGSWYFFGKVSQSNPKENLNVTAATGEAVKAGNTNQMVKERFISVNDSYFYLTKSGAMEKGWFTIKDNDGNKAQYYAKDNGTLFVNTVEKINSKFYYFKGDGIYYGSDKADDCKYVGQKADKSYELIDVEKDAEAKALVGNTYKQVWKLGTATTWK